MNKITYCKGCFMPSSRPRIVIAEDGYCNGCTYNKTKRENIDWDLRKKELKHILDKSKGENSNKVYDCVIAETSEGENYPIEVKEECRKLKGRMI